MNFDHATVSGLHLDARLGLEIDLLLKFPDSSMEGLKIHHTADRDMIAAAQRLYDKGLITLEDGGYLTDLGREAAMSAARLLELLRPQESGV
jgi:uncharacterized protein (TIGR02647 family)